MKTKIIASILILGFAGSILMVMFVTGCGVTSGGGLPFGPELYVGGYNSSTTKAEIIVLGSINGQIITRISLPDGARPDWLTFTPDRKKIYIS